MSYKKIIFILFMMGFSFTVLTVNIVKADAIDTMSDNLDMSMADVIMVVLSCGIVVIAAAEVRIAIMCAFLLYGSLFIVFTLATQEGISNFDPYYSGVAMMLTFVILVLSLLISYKKVNTPMNVV